MFRKKSSEKSAKQPFLYSHEIANINWGEKNARNNFSRNTRIVRVKMFGKKSTEKSAKQRFYIHKNIVVKKSWKIKGRNNFCRNTRIVRGKMLVNKSSEKSAKQGFLHSHEYRDQKMGGKKRAKQFFQKHTNSA